MNKQNKQEAKVFNIANNIESSTSEAAQQVMTDSSEFSPRSYLAQFYEGKIDIGNRALMHFYAKAYEDLEGRSLLEFGGGPTIYSIITAARTAS